MKSDSIIEVFVETVKGSRMVYEYDNDYNCLRCVEVLKEPMPFHYGFMINTDTEDGSLDAIILSDDPLVSQTILRVNIIGLLTMTYKENVKQHHKLIVTPYSTSASMTNIKDIPKNQTDIFISYWQNCEDHTLSDAESGIKIYLQSMIDDNSSHSSSEGTLSITSL